MIDYRVDLKSSLLPLASDMGRSVMVPSPKGSSVSESSNTPQVYFGEDIVPTAEGYRSVGYADTGIDTSAVVATILYYYVIYSEELEEVKLCVDTLGNIYYLNPSDAWALSVTANPLASTLDTGKVDGVSYILVQGTGVYTFSTTSNAFTLLSLTGVTAADIISITGATGYLVLADDNSVYWSSTIDPTDFVPSQVTGAGGGAVADKQGKIKYIASTDSGFFVYAEGNIVSADVTANKQYPFRFKAIPNSRGLVDVNTVGTNSDLDDQYLYTVDGLHVVNPRKSSPILPEVSDFLKGRKLDLFNPTTKEVDTQKLASTLLVRVDAVSSRYLVISYGVTEYTQLAVFDILLGRVGKLVYTHIQAIPALTSHQDALFALIDSQGKLVHVTSEEPSAGVLIAGKFQVTRGNVSALLDVELEGVENADTCDVSVSSTLPRVSPVIKAGHPLYVGEDTRLYGVRAIGSHHSVVVTGIFDLNTMILKLAPAGER